MKPSIRMFCTCFLVSLAIALPALAQVSQPAVFNLKRISQTGTTQTFEVNVDIFEVGGVCPPGGPYCVQYRTTVRIEPCPVGVTCSNGIYEYSYFTFMPRAQVTLNRMQEYTFNAQIRADVGTTNGNPCYFTCYFDQDAITKKFTPPKPVPEWEVTQESANQDSLWISVRLLYADEENECAVNHQCNVQQVHGTIDPAAFAVRGASERIYEGRTYFIAAPNATMHFALPIGHSYVLTGGHFTKAFNNEMSGACVEPRCTDDQRAPTKIIVATPTPTRRVTWGAVKATRRQE